MPRVAILGANGFLGAPIAKNLSNNGWEVFGFTRRMSSNLPIKQLYADLFDEESIRSALSIAKPEFVISTAWDTEHGKFWTSSKNESYRVATLKFAELCFLSGVQSFSGLGTMSEYGTSPGLCNSNSTNLVQQNEYSKSKVLTGMTLMQLANEFGTSSNWFRIFQAFGPNEKAKRLVPALISSLRRGEPYIIQTPNNCMDWIHSADVADAIRFSLETPLKQFVDIGTGIATSVQEIAELICSELKLDRSLVVYENQNVSDEVICVVDESSELLKSGWRPMESLSSRIHSLG
jgi:nucleoside-diphosphate-sugar epimerase